MKRLSPDETIRRIAGIIHNRPLARAIQRSVAAALKSSVIRLGECESVWGVFERSLDAAIRDIESHPRGKLFRRLIEHGPPNPDDPKAPTGDGETILSDPECGECVEFIHSHMVNRFKGELAELLAAEPCLELTRRLRDQGLLPKRVCLYWGGTIQERRRVRHGVGGSGPLWGGFAKGADGLIVEEVSSRKRSGGSLLKVHGVVEVKSMPVSKRRVMAQVGNHILRLRGGLRLAGGDWPEVRMGPSGGLRIMVLPSSWKLSREWYIESKGSSERFELPEPTEAPAQTEIVRLDSNVWRVKLAWSREAIEQAAYEMTFWYMSQVGGHVYSAKTLPEGWEKMTPENAGYNSIKMMLYYILLRYLTRRQDRLAIKLYNIYCFGYALGVDSKSMLWPKDFAGRAPVDAHRPNPKKLRNKDG